MSGPRISGVARLFHGVKFNSFIDLVFSEECELHDLTQIVWGEVLSLCRSTFRFDSGSLTAYAADGSSAVCPEGLTALFDPTDKRQVLAWEYKLYREVRSDFGHLDVIFKTAELYTKSTTVSILDSKFCVWFESDMTLHTSFYYKVAAFNNRFDRHRVAGNIMTTLWRLFEFDPPWPRTLLAISENGTPYKLFDNENTFPEFSTHVLAKAMHSSKFQIRGSFCPAIDIFRETYWYRLVMFRRCFNTENLMKPGYPYVD